MESSTKTNVDIAIALQMTPNTCVYWIDQCSDKQWQMADY